jgi:hypothetical protein
MQPYQLDCYRYEGLRVCRSVRHVCTSWFYYNWPLPCTLSWASWIHIKTYCVSSWLVTLLRNAMLPHMTWHVFRKLGISRYTLYNVLKINPTMASEFKFTLNTFIYKDIMCHLLCKNLMTDGLQHVRNPSVSAVNLLRSSLLFSFHGVSWFHLVSRPLTGLLYQPRITDEYGSFGGTRIGRENQNALRKHTPVPLCPS